ncbi:MAG: hypothetical protein ABJA66_20985, partial [Actinomycetota bacterium]
MFLSTADLRPGRHRIGNINHITVTEFAVIHPFLCVFYVIIAIVSTLPSVSPRRAECNSFPFADLNEAVRLLIGRLFGHLITSNRRCFSIN